MKKLFALGVIVAFLLLYYGVAMPWLMHLDDAPQFGELHKVANFWGTVMLSLLPLLGALAVVACRKFYRPVK